MKDSFDKQTSDLFEASKRGRGRPATGQAMTNAERQRAYRLRVKSQQKTVSVTENHDYQKMYFDAFELVSHLQAQCNAWANLHDNLRKENDQLKRRIDDLENCNVTEKQGQGG